MHRSLEWSLVSRNGGKQYVARRVAVCVVDYGGSMGARIYRNVWAGQDDRPIPPPTHIHTLTGAEPLHD